MSDTKTILAEQFDDLEQQREASTLGMWAFLATEVMFFGGLFLGYIVLRGMYPEAFGEGSRQSHLLLGAINTAVLLTSSLTMALAVHATREDNPKRATRQLLATIFLGLVFLAIKGVEYREHISHHLLPGASFARELPAQSELFFYLYFAMTGLHALHVLVGIGLLAVIAWLSRRGHFSSRSGTPVEVSGLYWHFVDLVWVFLYPVFYLIGRHS